MLLVVGSKFDLKNKEQFPLFRYPFVNYNALDSDIYDQFFFFKPDRKLPELTSKLITFSLCVENQIQELLKTKHKEIILLYSGGVDSKVILTALNLFKDQFYKLGKTIRIAITTDTIDEDSIWNSKLSTSKFEIVSFFSVIPDSESIIVTGEPGDLIFYGDWASQILSAGINKDILSENFESGYVKVLKKFYGQGADPIFKKYFSIFDNINSIKIKTTAQALWFHSFYLKLNYVTRRFLTMNPFIKSTVKAESFFNFYDSELFMEWALRRQVDKTIDLSYKIDSLDYIFKYDGPAISNLVVKKASLLNPIKFQKLVCGIDCAYNHISDLDHFRKKI